MPIGFGRSRSPRLAGLASDTIPGAMDYFQAVLNTRRAKLVFYYPMNEPSGTTALNYTGGQAGTYAGTFTLGQTGIGDGRTAALLTLGALNYYAALNATPTFTPQECTMTWWAKANDAAHMADQVGAYMMSLYASGNAVYATKYPGGGANLFRAYYATGGITKYVEWYRFDANWNHYAMTISKSAEAVYFYINGSLVSSALGGLGLWSGTWHTTINCLGAGRSDSFTSPWTAQECHTALWSTPLTGQEIRALHDAARTTIGYLVCGDSKSVSNNYPWARRAGDLLATANLVYEARPQAYAVSGWTSTNLVNALQAGLSGEWQIADRAWINIGANDLGGYVSEGTFKSNLMGCIAAIQAKYPACDIYIARPWLRSRAAEALVMKTWIDAVIALYSAHVFAGPDETVWLENGDDGVTYTGDGTHYNAAGVLEAANQWAALE